MKVLYIILLINQVINAWPASVSRGEEGIAQSRITGGQDTSIENVPYQVALYRYNSYISECGGVIISEYAVLTAAHCVNGLYIDDVTFSAGSSSNNRSGTLHRADWIVIHYDYDWTLLQNDIAFVKVVEPFVFNEQVQAVGLPTATVPAGTSAVTSGWGSLYVRGAQLQSVTISTVSLSSCQNMYAKFDLQPSADTLCAGAGEGPCDGDAGGPLVAAGTLIGIFAWRGTCGDPQHPAVFADVFHFRDFIDENLSYIRS